MDNRPLYTIAFIFIALFLSVVVSVVNAALPNTPLFEITPPTQFVSGASLNPAVDLAAIRVYCTGPEVMPPFDITVPDNIRTDGIVAWEAPFAMFAPGDWSCTASAITVPLFGGGESAQTAAVPFQIAVPIPGPPITFTVR